MLIDKSSSLFFFTINITIIKKLYCLNTICHFIKHDIYNQIGIKIFNNSQFERKLITMTYMDMKIDTQT